MYSKYRTEDYKVGWVCSLPEELTAARRMLDERHQTPKVGGTSNTYDTGRICHHNVVIATLPRPGASSAAAVITDMRRDFPIEYALIVGIGSGVPNSDHDIRLGDVVISRPNQTFGGVVQYATGTRNPNYFERSGSLNAPPSKLLSAVNVIRSNFMMRDMKVESNLELTVSDPGFSRPHHQDVLFEASSLHVGTKGSCQNCDKSKIIHRPHRPDNIPWLFCGTIASDNQVVEDALLRDELSRQLGVVLCFETEAAGLVNHTPCLVIRGIADYADTHRNEHWQRYAAATAAVYAREILAIVPPSSIGVSSPSSDISKSLGEIQIATNQDNEDPPTYELDQEEQCCLQEFRKLDYEAHKRRNPERIEGTCNWFLNHKSYEQWLKAINSSVLLVTADPGCGKSVLARFLIENELPARSRSPICYFFFKDDFEEQKSIHNALCSILHQAIVARPSLIQHALPSYRLEGGHLSTLFYTIWSIFETAVLDPTAGQMFCIMDALDECDEEQRRQLMDAINGFISASAGQAQVKFLITSRPYQSIKSLFATVAHIDLAGEENPAALRVEIELVIKFKARHLAAVKKLDASTSQFLEDKLIKHNNTTYLWLYLIFQDLENSSSTTSVGFRKILQVLPETVEDTYEKILSRSTKPQEARKLFSIILAATRALSVEEMNMALETTPQNTSVEELEVQIPRAFQERARNICGLFVTILDEKIYLIHQTAREFLLQTVSSVTIPRSVSQIWKASIILKSAHRILAQVCIVFLAFDEFEERQDWCMTNFDFAYWSRSRGLKLQGSNLPFTRYAAASWAFHLKEAGMRSEELPQQFCAINRIDSALFKSWVNHYWDEKYSNDKACYYLQELPKGMTPLLIAAELGVMPLLLQALSLNPDINQFDGSYDRTALMWAVCSGHVEIVEHLLQCGADPNIQGSMSDTALTLALSVSHRIGSSTTIRIVDLLLSRNVQVDFESPLVENPLETAINIHSIPIAKRLLDAGANVNMGEPKTPLEKAISTHQVDMVFLLVHYGANVDSVAHGSRTPLCAAIEEEREDIAELLLKRGANINYITTYGEFALEHAVHKLEPAWTLWSLDNGANIELSGTDGMTALMMATSRCHEAVATVLLQRGANVDPINSEGMTPLMIAAKRGRESLCKMLLLNHASKERRDKDGRTAYDWAKATGKDHLLGLLRYD